MSQSTLTTLPKELREKILTEALSIENNTVFDAYNDHVDIINPENAAIYVRLPPAPHERKVEWKITTPLFLVNKQIFYETQACFHRENTPVSIQTHGYPFLKNCATQIIPMCLTRSRKMDVALHLKLDFFTERWMAHVGGYEGSFEFAVMAARDLPTLVQLVNATSIPRARQTVKPDRRDLFYVHLKDLSLNFDTGSKFYIKEVNDATNKLVNGMKGIRRFQWREWRARGPPLVGPSLDRTFVIDGLSEVKTNELLAASNLPCWTVPQCIEEAKRFKEQGDSLEKGGRDAAARVKYILSTLMVSEQSIPRARLFHDNYFSGRSADCLTTILTSWFATERVAEKLSPDSSEALALKRGSGMVLSLAFSAAHLTPPKKEEILIAYGKELLQHHKYERFRWVCEQAISCNTEEYVEKEREGGYGERNGETLEERKLLRLHCEKHIERSRDGQYLLAPALLDN